MGRHWLAIGLLFTTACSTSTEPDRGNAHVDALLQLELAFVPRDYTVLHISRLESAGVPITFFTMTFCDPDVTGDTVRNAAGVPHDVTLTYAPERCGQSGGSFTDSYSGAIRIQDPGASALARVTYTNFRHTLGTGSLVDETSLDGTVELRAADAGTLTVVQHTTERQAHQGSAGNTQTTRRRDLTVLIADTTGSFIDGTLVPSAITLTGTMDLVYGATNDSLRVQLATPVPLVPDFLCLTGFRDGQVRLVATGTAKSSFTLTYSCQ